MEREQDGLQHLAGNRYQWNGSRVGCSTWLATTINGTRAGWVAEIAITVKGTRAEKLTLTAGRPPGIRPHQPAQLDARGSTKPQLIGRESGHADLENISWFQHPSRPGLSTAATTINGMRTEWVAALGIIKSWLATAINGTRAGRIAALGWQ